MKSRFRVSRVAAAELEAIWNQINEQSSGRRAREIVRRILARANLLARFPGSGRLRPDIRPNWRSVAEGPFVIFYREVENGVELMRVIHGSRDLEQLFHDEEETD